MVSAALTSLSLAKNNLTDYSQDISGVQALASALAGNAVLTNLSVASNNITGAAAQQLAAARPAARLQRDCSAISVRSAAWHTAASRLPPRLDLLRERSPLE